MKKIKLFTITILLTFILFPYIVKAATFLEASTQRPVVGSDVYVLLNAMYGDLEIKEVNVRIKYDPAYLRYDRTFWIQGKGTVTTKDGYLYIKKSPDSRNWTSGNQMQFKFTVLKEGVSKVEIDAVDENGQVVESYYANGDPVAQSFANVTINAVKPSTNTFIGSLYVEGYNLSPTFSKTKYEYSLNVPADVTSVNIVAKQGEKNQTITGTGIKKLDYGANRVRVVVSAQDGSSRTYLIVINRKDDRTGDTTLKSLTVSNTNITYDKNKTTYEATVSKTVDSILITAITNDPNATMTGTGKQQLNIGSNTFKLHVTSSGGNEATYTIIINRSNEVIEDIKQSNKLKSLNINNLGFTLDDEKNYYTISIPNNINILNIEAIPESKTATVEILDNNNLQEGINLITVKVTEKSIEDEKQQVRNYLIVAFKQPNNAKLVTELNTNITSNIIYETTIDTSHIISKDILDTLKDNNYKLYYEVVNIYNGLEYQVTLNNISSNEDLDVSLNQIDNKNLLTYETKLPKDVDILLYLNERYLDGVNVRLYSYTTEGQYNLITDGIKVDNGYVKFTTNGDTHYIITTEDLLPESEPLTAFFKNNLPLIIGVIVIIIVILLLLNVIKKKKGSKSQNEPLY